MVTTDIRVLWKHEGNFNKDWECHPSFSKSGSWAAFQVGDRKLAVLHIRSTESLVVETIDLGFLTGAIQSLAIECRKHIAVAALQQPGTEVIKHALEERTIQVVPITILQRFPTLCRPDKERLILAYCDSEQPVETTVTVDIWHGSQQVKRIRLDNVKSFACFGHDSVTLFGRNWYILDITGEIPENLDVGVLFPSQPQPEIKVQRRIVAVSPSGWVRDMYPFTEDDSQTIISDRGVMVVQSDGQVHKLLSSPPGSTAPVALSKGKQRINGRVAAFINNRIILVSNGRISSLETEPI